MLQGEGRFQVDPTYPRIQMESVIYRPIFSRRDFIYVRGSLGFNQLCLYVPWVHIYSAMQQQKKPLDLQPQEAATFLSETPRLPCDHPKVLDQAAKLA
jgi:hypothetical protein